jgi:hypothetical protein
MSKKLLFSAILFSSPLFQLGLHASMQVQQTRSSRRRQNNGLVRGSAGWFGRQFKQKERSARLLLRNGWPSVIEKTIGKMQVNGQNQTEEEVRHMQLFLKDILPEAREKLKLQTSEDLQRELERNNIDFTATDFQDRAANVLAERIYRECRGAYQQWLVEFKREVAQEEVYLNNRSWRETAYDFLLGFNAQQDLPSFFLLAPRSNLTRTKVTRASVERLVIAKRQYTKQGFLAKKVVDVAKLVDTAKNLEKAALCGLGFPISLDNSFQEAVLDCEDQDSLVSQAVKVVATVVIFCIIGYVLVASGLVWAALQGLASVAGAVLFPILFGAGFALALGGAVYYTARSLGFGGKGALLFAVLAAIIFFVGEALYLKEKHPKKYRRVKREARKLLDPVGLFCCATLPPLVIYGSYYCANFCFGLPMWVSLGVASTVACVSLLVAYAYIASSLARLEKRKDAELGIWGHLKKEASSIGGSLKGFFKNGKKKKWSKEKKVGVSLLVLFAFLVSSIVYGRINRSPADDLPDVPEREISINRGDFGDEELRDISRRNSLLLNSRPRLQQSGASLVGDPSSDEEESGGDGQDDIFAASPDREASIASLSDDALHDAENKLERKISSLEKEDLLLNDQNDQDDTDQLFAIVDVTEKVEKQETKKKRASFEIQGGKKLLSNEEVEKAWFTAAENGDNAKLDEIYKNYQMDPNTKDNSSWNALLCAAYRGQDETIDHLIQTYGLDINAKDNGGKNALLVAARYGHNSTIDHLIQTYHMDVNAKDDKGENALLWAVWGGHKDTIEHLIKNYQMDPNIKNKYGKNAISLARNTKRTATVDLLKRLGAKEE